MALVSPGNEQKEGLAKIVSARPSLRGWEVPSSIPKCDLNPTCDFFPFRVALSSFKYL